jgi:DNA-binding transcriptional LysR family regulator
MDLWQLKIFAKVVELKSFSQAGKAVNLSQPTVSSHIKALENDFGCPMIDRLGREMALTKAGEVLYAYARKIIALCEETQSALSDFNGKMKGRLAVGGSTIPGTYILPEIMGGFKKKFPDVVISLRIGDTQTTLEKILAGDIELAIVGAKSYKDNILQKKLLKDEMMLIVAKDEPWTATKQISLEMLTRLPFIVREAGSGTLKAIELNLANVHRSLSDLTIVAEMSSTAAVIEGIKNKVGVSILSPMAVSEALASGSLQAITIKGVSFKRSFYLTRHKHRHRSPICKAFSEFVLEKYVRTQN